MGSAGRLRRIEVEADFVAGAEDGEFVVGRGEQWQHVAIARVGSQRARVGTGGAGFLVDVLHVARRGAFDLVGIAVEFKIGVEREGYADVEAELTDARTPSAVCD